MHCKLHWPLDIRVWCFKDVVSVLNVSVSRRSRDVFRNDSSRPGFEGSTSPPRLSLEDITSWSRVLGFVTLGLVNIHAVHRAYGYISKKIMDLTRKNRLSSDRLHQLVFLNCDTAVLIRFLERLGFVSVLRVWENVTSRSRLGLVT